MTEQEAIWVLKDFDKQVTEKADGAYQSTIGEIACDVAISALEEIQQYRALEEELNKYQTNIDLKTLLDYFIETIFKGEEHKRFCILTNEDAEKWDAYNVLGTLEELQEAREKQVPKKAVFVHPIQLNDGGDYMCPTCKTGTILNAYGGKSKYCPWCGQAIDWS